MLGWNDKTKQDMVIEPNYDAILKEKVDYYGETKAAYEFAARAYAKQFFDMNKHNVDNDDFIKWLDEPC